MTESASVQNQQTTFTHKEIVTILIGLMAGMFLAALDQTVVSTAMKTIADDLDGFTLQAWVTTAFLITSTISNPLYGKLSDIYGRRPFFIVAIVLFVLGSALCGLSQSMYQLAAFRAFQGLGAGGLFSIAFTILGDIVPPRERSKYQGYFMAVFGTSSVLGPVIGGLLASAHSILGVSGWRWIFYVNVPIGIVSLIVVTRVLHLPNMRRPHRIDWPGSLSLIMAVVPLLVVAEQGREWGWTSTNAFICYAIVTVGIALFLLAETKYGVEAILPIHMFKNKTFGITSLGSLVVGAGMFGGIMLIPLYLQVVKGASPVQSGFQMLPTVVGIMTGAMISGKRISTTGKYKKWPLIGLFAMIIGSIGFSRVAADTPLWIVMSIMPIYGLGLGFNMQSVMIAVQNAVDPRDMGVATSSVTFFRQMGGTIGIAVLLSILFSTLVPNVADEIAVARTTPAFQSAAAQNPKQIAELQSGGSSFNDSSFIKDLDPVLAAPIKKGFSKSMDHIFVVVTVIVSLGFLVMFLIPEVPLRNDSGLQARMREHAEAAPA